MIHYYQCLMTSLVRKGRMHGIGREKLHCLGFWRFSLSSNCIFGLVYLLKLFAETYLESSRLDSKYASDLYLIRWLFLKDCCYTYM